MRVSRHDHVVPCGVWAWVDACFNFYWFPTTSLYKISFGATLSVLYRLTISRRGYTNLLLIMFCKHCGKELNEKAAVCTACGVRVGEGNTYCANCGAQHDPLAAICVKCGAAIRKSAGSSPDVVNGFTSAISTCWKKYADFEGRANLSEYWYWVLFSILLWFIPFVNFIAWLVLLLPSIAVAVRRLHDTGHSGWWYFLGFVPIVGWIILLIWYVTPSQQGDNEYGPEPR